MTKPTQPTGFSAFAWGLAIFCLPSILWPLALLISPSVGDNPNLSKSEIDWFSTALWVYPLGLLLVTVLLSKLRKSAPRTAQSLLALGFVLFYAFAAYLITTVWI